MTDHSPISACPDCGTPLPPDSPQALCPACLMRQALASRTIVEGDPKASTTPPLSPEEIADKFPGFEILECLGRGGMGVVYKARQKSLNRIVAIKILAPERGGETRFAERFAREAEFLAKLNHPHIVTIHDFGEIAGLFYLVMEFVDGVNLRDLLRDGKLEPQQALAIVPPICDALQYAHDKGIVHRDIKPENLLLDRDGRIKIADFGISALMGTDGDPSGTPPYMAPEQCGASPEVDNRADIYALGVVLYEMLTGERPKKELIAPSKKVHIDVRLDEIVLRALEKTPELRYQTAGIFKTQVETIVSEMASAAVPVAKSETYALNDSRFSRTAIVGACLVLIHIILLPLVHYTWQGNDFSGKPHPDRPPYAILVYTEWAFFVGSLIAMTILGWKAVGQIRRSGGRLHGMWLALFDGLLLPLFVASMAGGLGLHFLLEALNKLLWSITGRDPDFGVSHGLRIILIALVLTPLVIRFVRSKVSKPLAVSQHSEQPMQATSRPPAPETKPTRLGKWAVGLFIGAIVGAPLLGGFMGAQEVIVLCGLALLLSLVFGVMSWRSKPGKFAALASGLGLLLLVAFTSHYLTPRPPRGPYEGGGMTSAYTPVKDNLLAAISARYGDEESRFELGKPMDLDLLFLNYSPIDMVINPQELPPAAWLTVTNSAGERVELKGTNQAASVLKEPRIVQSRDGTGGYAMSLLLLPKNDTTTAKNAKADAMAWVEPGTYTLQFHLRLPPTSYQPDGSSKDEYRTVPITIEVAGTPTMEKATKPSFSFGPVVEHVQFTFKHPEALVGGHELTLPTTDRKPRRVLRNGQPLVLTNNQRVLAQVQLLESSSTTLKAEVACSEEFTDWETQVISLSVKDPKGKLLFKNGTEATVELLGTGITGSSEPPNFSFGPVMERELRVDEQTLAQGLNFESGKVLTLSLEEFNRKADDGTGREPSRSFSDRVAAKGMDMCAVAGDKGFGLAGLITEFKLSALPVAAWYTATESQLHEALEHATMEGDKFLNGLLIPTDAELPLTYAMKSGDKFGLLQITARLQNPDGIQLRYKLLEDVVIDQVVPNIHGRELGDLKCFDFESNRFHTPPEALADELLSAVNRAQTKNPAAPWLGVRVSPALIGWLDQTGVDVVAASYDSGAQLLSLTSGRAGDEVEKLRIPEDALTLARIADLYWPRQPKSGFFGFTTREGNRGDLQITGITDDRFRDVKIRYKLVHKVPPEKSAAKKQYELSIQFGQNPNDPVVKTDVELGTQFGNFKKAGDRLFSISGQIDEPKNGKFPGSITLGDFNVSEEYKGTGHQGTIPVELELGKPFNHTVVVGIGFIRIITLNEKPASSEPVADPAATDTSEVDGARGEHFEPIKELEIPLQDFPEGGGREGYRLTVAPGAGGYVLATLREYEGTEVIGEKTPVKRQVARLLRTQSASHSEDIFLDVYGDDVKTRIAAGSRYGVSGFGQQVVITGLDFDGGSGNSVGGEKQPRFVTRRFKFIDSGGDKARTFIVEFEMRMISKDDTEALAKRRGFSLPDENVANWAITLSAEPAKEGEKAGP